VTLNGWRNEQLSRNLAPATIAGRERAAWFAVGLTAGRPASPTYLR
jgi:hypothetical protein